MATGVGWPGLLPDQGGAGPVTDKAARYTTCIENAPGNQIQITNNRPDGPRIYLVPGQIPQDARRVVFHDAEYDGPKRGDYNPNVVDLALGQHPGPCGSRDWMPAPPRIDLMAPVSVPPQARPARRVTSRMRFPRRSALQRPKSSPAVAPPSRPATSWALGSLSLPSHWRSSCGRPERVAEPSDRRTRLVPAVPAKERDRVGGKVVAELAARGQRSTVRPDSVRPMLGVAEPFQVTVVESQRWRLHDVGGDLTGARRPDRPRSWR